MTNAISSLRTFQKKNTKSKRQIISNEKKKLLKEYKILNNLTRLPYGFSKNTITYIKTKINEENNVDNIINKINYNIFSKEKPKYGYDLYKDRMSKEDYEDFVEGAFFEVKKQTITEKNKEEINILYNKTFNNDNYRIKYNFLTLLNEDKQEKIKNLFKKNKITEEQQETAFSYLSKNKISDIDKININKIKTYSSFHKIELLKYEQNTLVNFVTKYYKEGNYVITTGALIENKKGGYNYIVRNEKVDMKHVHSSKAVQFFLKYTYASDLLGINKSTETNEKSFKPMRDGSNNCVIQCIKDLNISFPKRNSFETLNEKYLESGVNKEQMEYIAKTLKIKIELYVYGLKFTFGNIKRNQKTIKLYNKNAHCTIKPVQKSETIYCTSEIINNKIENINHNCVLNYYNDLNNNIISLEVKENNDINSTKSILYIVKNINNIDLEEHKCLSDIQYYNKLFFEKNKQIDTIKYDNVNFDIIKQYPNNSIYYCNNESIFNHETLEYECSYKYKTIDLITAFNNFAKFSNYTGFPKNLNIALKADALTDDILYNFEGIAYVEYIDILTNKYIKRLISFPFIRFLKESNIYYKIIFVLMSNESLDLDTSPFNKLNKRCLQKVFGCMMKTSKSYSFCTTDKEVAKSYGSFSEQKWHWNDDDTLYQCKEFYEDKELTRYCPHIVGYIKDYVNIQILKQVLILQQNNIAIKRIWVDGIDVNTNANITNLYDKSIFKVKSTKVNDTYNLNIQSLEIETPEILHDSFNKFKLNNNITLITGSPGTGKSYNIKQLYNQNNNCLILTPTHILKKMYKGFEVKTFQSTQKKPTLPNYSHVFIDEYTMISQKDFNALRAKLDENTKIILVGDKNQLSLDFGDPIKITDDIEVITLTKNYRQLDNYFQQMIDLTLKKGSIDWIKQTITENDAVQQPNTIILSATNNEVERLNIIGHKLNKNEQYKNCKINTPIKFITTTKSHCNNELGICVELHEDYFICKKDNGDLIKVKYDYESWIYGYSITYHCMQGLTIKDKNIILNTNNLFDKKRMLYVGVSRASDINQLYKLI